MVLTRDSELFGFDVDDAIRRIDDSSLPKLQIIAEYTGSEYRDLYVSDSVIETVGGSDAYEKQRDLVAEFFRLDYIDRDAYQDIVPRAGTAELFVTQAADILLVRVFRDNGALLIVTDKNGSLDELVGVAKNLVDHD